MNQVWIAAGQIAPVLLGLLGGAKDEGINRLCADRPQANLDPALQPAGDLLRRPSLRQTIDDEASQSRFSLQDRGPLATEAVGALGEDWTVCPVLMPIAPQFAADGGSMPSERSCDGARAEALGFQIGDLIPFGTGEVGIS